MKRLLVKLAYRFAEWAAGKGQSGWWGLYDPLPGCGQTRGWRLYEHLNDRYRMPWSER